VIDHSHIPQNEKIALILSHPPLGIDGRKDRTLEYAALFPMPTNHSRQETKIVSHSHFQEQAQAQLRYQSHQIIREARYWAGGGSLRWDGDGREALVDHLIAEGLKAVDKAQLAEKVRVGLSARVFTRTAMDAMEVIPADIVVWGEQAEGPQ
jgi:hypothetical protein